MSQLNKQRKADWETTSQNVILSALLLSHPQPREMLVEAQRLKDSEDFSFVYEGTIKNLKRMRLITELPKTRKTMFRRFCLTLKGMKEAHRRSISEI